MAGEENIDGQNKSTASTCVYTDGNNADFRSLVMEFDVASRGFGALCATENRVKLQGMRSAHMVLEIS